MRLQFPAFKKKVTITYGVLSTAQYEQKNLHNILLFPFIQTRPKKKSFTILLRMILSSCKQNRPTLHAAFQTLSQNANMADGSPVTRMSGTLLADLACSAITHHGGHVQPTSYTRRRKLACVTGTAKEASPRTQPHRQLFVLWLWLKRVTQESGGVLEANLFGD